MNIKAVKRKKLLSGIIFFVLPLLLCACKNTEFYEQTFFALDTVITIKCEEEGTAKKVKDEVLKYEKILSPTNSESELYLINSGAKNEVSPEFSEVFYAAKDVAEKTAGAYNFAIYPLVLKWGFTTKEYNVPEKWEVEEILHRINFTKLTINDNMLSREEGAMLDFGGIAKGFICDRAVSLIKESGQENALLSMGGNVYALGEKNGREAWSVAVKSPFSEEAAGVLKVKNRAVVTSGAYERFFEKDGKIYHHILDPETGYPADNNLASVTIVSESAALADGYSTALFVMGFEKAKEFYLKNKDFEAVFILNSGEIFITEGLEGSFEAEKFDII